MNIPILVYHQIDQPPPSGTPLRGLVVSPASFSRQMRALKLLGYRGLSMRELEPYLTGEKKGKVVGITFDDGYQNNLRNALPVLSKFGFSATCYGLSDMMGGTNSWDHGVVATKPLMTADEWRIWIKAGMDVGSHTRTHARLIDLSPTDAHQQIVDSKRELEQRLGCEVRHFCYPYGSFAPEHCVMVKEAGYVTATTMNRGRNQAGDDLYRLRRIMVACSTHLGLFLTKVLTGYEDRRR
jgi:peptidoglycan/xylan/chitin deacetylase (PgdA/CDA1 family)